jgi:SAM-dependent methyltransferase
MNVPPGFFDFAAEVGLTKHIGGLEATEALIELCHIHRDSYVLDVGCGVGATPCYLAKKLGCRVVDVDISPKMVRRSRQRARRENVADRVESRVADAQELLLYARSRAYRKFVKGVRAGGLVPENLEAYFGYGTFAGRK